MTKEELRKSLDFVNEERERLQRENDDLRSAIADYLEVVGDYQDELKRKDNIINELEIYIKASDDCWDLQAVLDKLKELKENK